MGREVAARLGEAAEDRLRRIYATRGSTPFRLRAAMLATVVLLLAFGVAGNYGINRRAAAIADARRAATQLLAVQEIRVAVVEADSIASRSFLVGGQEQPAERQSYLDDLAKATSQVVAVGLQLDLADDQATALASVSSSLSAYAGFVEEARANNRQGFPVGTAYQREANTVLTDEIVPALRTVEQGQRDAVNDGLARAHRAGAWLVAAGVLAILAVLAGGLWMALRFRRLVNVPLAIALAALLAIVVGGAAAQGTAMTRSDDAVSSSLTKADAVSQARAAAFDARSQEALTLINRGNGQANEANWKASTEIVDAALQRVCGRIPDGCESADAYGSYKTQHVKLHQLDDSGDWDAAVRASLGQQPTASAGSVDAAAPFAVFADASQRSVESFATTARSEFGVATKGLGLLRLGAVVAAVLAALLVLAGYGQRLREYQ